ncbi:MAG: thermonuclease family protein [Hyphomicrobiales bacterium]
MSRRRYKSRYRKVVDWAVMLLAAGAIIVFIVGLPQREVGGEPQVIDGDSLIISGTEIRLFGIDAPEGQQVCTNAEGAEYKCGREAARALRGLIKGRNIACTIVTSDRYGRNVSRCTHNMQSINKEMVRQGWAIAYRSHSSDYIAAETEAKNAKRGVWQGKFERPQDWRHTRGTAGDAMGRKLLHD